ncbi:DoxX family protein [Antribacter sp. KLBMP9083]|uniref:DoxX family protein n=1 Tax=Antribacter soli TaxID=2910976 RepID=A0AA41QI11_9MICO|nr:DoxX family protein [Antribacter soli]MCF4123562.1 DoxX family protein [Antribacter soli]
MEPLIALVVVTSALLVAGAAGVARLRPWPVALRGGLAVMFLMTGGAHFIGLRQELIDMVPPALPNPGVLVTVTGVLELAGAVGLLLRRTVPWAAAGLTALLVVMFPANVYYALEGVGVPWYDELLPRTLMQLIFLAATGAVLAWYLRGARPRPARD